MAKRILLIAYPFAGTGANMLRYRSFASYLAGKGYHVDVIGYYELIEDLPKGVTYYKIGAKFSFSNLQIFISLFIQNTYLLRVQGLKSYFKRVGLAALTYSKVLDLLNTFHYEACLVGVLPWAYYLIIPLLKKHIYTVVDIGDPLYKNAINQGSNNYANFRLERDALQSADRVITMNEPTIPIMVNEMGILKDKVAFVSPAMNVENSYNMKKKLWDMHRPLRILYSGSLYSCYRDLSEVQPALESLNGEVILDVYTNSICKPKKTNNVFVYDVVPHKQILQLYQEADILLFIDNSYGYQVPSKIFEILAQNKPILFVYDKRNCYFRNMLKGQQGIYFVENHKDLIKECLISLSNIEKIEVNYTIDLHNYSEDAINYQLFCNLLNI